MAHPADFPASRLPAFFHYEESASRHLPLLTAARAPGLCGWKGVIILLQGGLWNRTVHTEGAHRCFGQGRTDLRRRGAGHASLSGLRISVWMARPALPHGPSICPLPRDPRPLPPSPAPWGLSPLGSLHLELAAAGLPPRRGSAAMAEQV